MSPRDTRAECGVAAFCYPFTATVRNGVRAKKTLKDTGARDISSAAEAAADYGTTDKPTERPPAAVANRGEAPVQHTDRIRRSRNQEIGAVSGCPRAGPADWSSACTRDSDFLETITMKFLRTISTAAWFCFRRRLSLRTRSANRKNSSLKSNRASPSKLRGQRHSSSALRHSRKAAGATCTSNSRSRSAPHS
jgi:hypothetical protein